MALIVEDGTLVSGAEAYISVADADTYFTDRGSPTTWTGATTGQKEAALKYAAQYMDLRYRFNGCLQDTTQALSFPRTSFYNYDGRLLAGSGVIPDAIKNANAELALRHLIQDLFFSSNPDESRVTSKKIGDAAETYDVNRSSNRFTYIDILLGDYLLNSPSVVPIIRG